MKRILFAIPVFLLTGCSIYMASRLPIARPPEELQTGVMMDYVDRRFGFPIASGVDGQGSYVEQLQFIDGVPIGWKVARFCIHAYLDACTFCLWEFIGTPIELACNDYPICVYYVVYDSNGRIVRAVSSTSEEGARLSKLPWSSPYVEEMKVNKDRKVRLRYWQNKKELNKPIEKKNKKGVGLPQQKDSIKEQGGASRRDIKRLRDAGVLSQEEFDAEMKKISENPERK